jgi:RNA polymerase sigma-70 factor (ECF subfamily)
VDFKKISGNFWSSVTGAVRSDTITIVGHSTAVLADLMLVDRCKDGEQAATRELFRTHQRRVYATLYRILGSSSEMDDLLQETFIQVFKSLPSFRGDSRLSTWIDRIAVRIALRHIKRRKNTPLPMELVEPATHIGPGDRAMAREGIRHLYEALHKLPSAGRVAFALFEIDGRSVAEVAEITGASVTTTKLRIWRARKLLLKLAANDPFLADLLGDTLSEARA